MGERRIERIKKSKVYILLFLVLFMANPTENLALYNPELVRKVSWMYGVLRGLNREHGYLKYCKLRVALGPFFEVGQMIFSLSQDPQTNLEFQRWFGFINDPRTDNGASFTRALEKYLGALEDAIFQETFKAGGVDEFLQGVNVERKRD